MYFYLQNFRTKLFYLALIALSLIVLYFTHSRASILATGLSFTYILVLFVKKRVTLVRNRSFLWMLALFVVFLCLVVINSKYSNIFTNFDTVRIRFSIWKYFFSITSREFPIFGIGPDNESLLAYFSARGMEPQNIKHITNYITLTQASPHAHNLTVQLFNHYGVFGIGVYLFIISYFAFFFIRSFFYKKEPMAIFLSLICLLAIFIQELFDYTMPDPVIFSPMMLFLGMFGSTMKITTRDTSTYKNWLIFKRVVIVFLFGFTLLVSWNYTMRNYIHTIFKKRLVYDAFENYKFVVPLELFPSKVKQFLKMDSYYLPIKLDSKREILTGFVYWELYRNRNYSKKEYCKIAVERFENCVSINPYLPICYYKLAQIYKHEGDVKKSQFYLNESKKRDPFQLVKENP
ncbi:MAG: O-antigen ligase family protein [Spirochaetota bacterium]